MLTIHKPYTKFKGWLREYDLTYADLADVLGITTTTVSAKINGSSDFLLSEINLLRSKYNLESELFFTD